MNHYAELTKRLGRAPTIPEVLDEFDPNNRPQAFWATYCLRRNPEFKLHRTKGSAKAAITTHAQGGTVLYTWSDRRMRCGVPDCDASLGGLNAASAPICGEHDAIMIPAPGWVQIARTQPQDTCDCCGANTYATRAGYVRRWNRGTWAWVKSGSKNTDTLWFLCYECRYNGPRCPQPII